MEQNKINALWHHIRNNLFSPKTNLIYDCRTSPDPAQRFAFLPTPEEIAISIAGEMIEHRARLAGRRH